MAIFNTINKKSGLLVGVIIVALLLFLLTDAFFGQNSILGRTSNDVGEINGEDIDYTTYQRMVDRAEAEFEVFNGRPPRAEDRERILEEAWNNLIFNVAYQDQFEKLGMKVTEQEWKDIAQGDFIHPVVKSLFPVEGEFKKEFVQNFIGNLKNMSQKDQMLWFFVDNKLPEIRLREKYTSLFNKTAYIPAAEAKRQHIAQNKTASYKYVNVPFYSIPDSTIAVNDADLRDYLESHKDEYKVEEGRSIDYVIFSVTPSGEDTLALKQELQDVAKSFSNAENDSLFVAVNSEKRGEGIKSVRMSDFPYDMQNSGAIVPGKVYGPHFDNEEGVYKVIKVLDTKEDSIYTMRASHILFKTERHFTEEQKTEVKQEAQKVLEEIKKGASFAEMAKEHGSDATAFTGGDLGWFKEGNMVKPFEQAVKNTSGTGLLPLVETEYGYHIVKVTEPKMKKAFEVAEVVKNVNYTEQTKDAVYQEAVEFQMNSDDSAAFYANAKANESLQVYSAKSVGKNARDIPGIDPGREIVRWAYNDAQPGDVSEVITLDDKFVVAVLTDKQEKGVQNLEEIREKLTAKVKEEKKANKIIETLQGLNGSLDEIAKAYGPSALAGKADSVKLGSPSLEGIGYDVPEAAGRILGLKAGEKSKPFRGKSSVYIVEVTATNEVPEIADYTSVKTNISSTRAASAQSKIHQAIIENAEIEDTRYKYY